MRCQAPRGTEDVLPEQVGRWRHVEETFRRVCARYGYGELRTPTFEPTDLFVRSVGQHTDIVSKEMYSVLPSSPERGERAESLTLRPEGTAPAMRAYLEQSMGAKAPLVKLYYLCAIFRHEATQRGRLREHHQAGIEAIGSQEPALDAEVIALALDFLHRLDITGEATVVNSIGCASCRPAYRDALRAALRNRIEGMCENCRRRYDTNPLRILDCKFEDWTALGDIPDILDYLCEECAAHFRGVGKSLGALGVEFRREPRLVRGFDYYTKTAFEITHPGLGAQNVLVGGGRYDGLIEELGGEPTPGIGFGCGIERVLLAAEDSGAAQRWPVTTVRPIFVITLGETARLTGLELLAALRRAGLHADIDYLGRSMKSQMRQANRLNARAALILGEDEVSRGVVSLKDLDGGEQVEVLLAEAVMRAADLLTC